MEGLKLAGLPKWLEDDLVKQPRSKSHRTVDLKLFDSDESISLPVHTSTTVLEVKNLLAYRLLIQPDSMHFVVKQGCAWRAPAGRAREGNVTTRRWHGRHWSKASRASSGSGRSGTRPSPSSAQGMQACARLCI